MEGFLMPNKNQIVELKPPAEVRAAAEFANGLQQLRPGQPHKEMCDANAEKNLLGNVRRVC
jgi:hypothetical protein